MDNSSHAPTTQVVVVGAGPTGLMLACELRLAGVDVLVVERRATGTVGESRAPGINARTMEILAQRGIADRFRRRGKPMPAVMFSGMPMFPQRIDPEWPEALILPQHETERILAERAEELGVRFRWSATIGGVEQDDASIRVTVESADGSSTVTAAYLVGCDGGHSRVRQLSGIAFPGDEPISDWLVGDVRLASPPDPDGVFGRNETIGTYQISRTEPEWFRLSLMRVTPPADRRAPVTLDELRAAMIDGLGTDHGLTEARWLSRFSDGFRQVPAYRSGRILLAGDAAHTHSPIGGQGLNLGVQDATNLGWKLGAVVAGTAPASLLDTYHEERHAAAEAVLTLTRAQTALIKPGRQNDALRSVVSGFLSLPDVCLPLSGALSGVDLRYRVGDGHPLLGRRLPDLPITVDGEPGDTYDALAAARPVLFSFGDASVEVPNPWTGRVDVVRARTAGGVTEQWRLPVVGVVPTPEAVLVRPDGYVAWLRTADASAGTDGLEAALTRWLGA